MACDGSLSLADVNSWESEMITQFETDTGRKWREGKTKMSFNYLLLDPRTTKNLPARHHILGTVLYSHSASNSTVDKVEYSV